MKPPMPAVSVIVPIYNVREYLHQCIQSLAAQTLSSIEFLLIDDGSTDGSGDLAASLVAGDRRFSLHRKPNGGLSDARNYGIERARGQYIGFVDSDDWIEPSMFEKLYDKAIETDSQIVVCAGTRVIDATGEEIPMIIRGKTDIFGSSVRESPEILYASRSLACNKIFARELFDDTDLRFPVGQWYEDSAIIYNVMAMANRVDCVPEQFYNYRIERDGQITGLVSEKTFDIFKSCQSIIDFYRDKGLLYGKIPSVLEKIIRGHIVVRFDVVLDHADKKLARRYINQAFDFMDELFPGWASRYPVQKKKKWSWKFHARRNRMIAHARVAAPASARKLVGKSFLRSKKLINQIRKLPADHRAQRSKLRQQEILQKHGYKVLNEVGTAIQSAGASYFADFGTLLGFVRDGGFMAHDLDLDIGVLANEDTDISAVRKNLLSIGCTLWREYVLNGLVVEESYHFPVEAGKSLKFDINYYRSDDTHSKTYLFYLDPKQKYRPRERSIAEMTYTRIEGLTEIAVGGHHIPIPTESERLLAEKYGANWRIPDTNWIYWRSPAATPLPRREFFRQPPKIPADKLRALQLEQLVVLDAVAALCEKHGFRYYLNEGTLLGAVRHQGYIPWDDDIDIAMPREDYDRLVALPRDAWPAQARLWWHTTDPKYHLPFAKAVATGPSSFRNSAPRDIAPEFAGPRIDIFPLDRVPFESGPEQSSHWATVRMLRDMLQLKRGLPKKRSWSNRRRKLMASLVSYRMLHTWLYRVSTRHNSSLLSVYTINNGSSYRPSRQKVPAEWYGSPSILEYEGRRFPGPAQPEKILSKIYGDYLTPPPEDKRVNTSHYMRYYPNKPASSNSDSAVDQGAER